MTEAAPDLRSVIVERDVPHPPEKVWRALTQPHLIEEWLMKNDFKPILNRMPECLDTAGCDTPECSVNTRTVCSPSRLNRSKIARRVGSESVLNIASGAERLLATALILRACRRGCEADERETELRLFWLCDFL